MLILSENRKNCVNVDKCSRLMNLLYAKMADNCSYIDMYELCKDIQG